MPSSVPAGKHSPAMSPQMNERVGRLALGRQRPTLADDPVALVRMDHVQPADPREPFVVEPGQLDEAVVGVQQPALEIERVDPVRSRGR